VLWLDSAAQFLRRLRSIACSDLRHHLTLNHQPLPITHTHRQLGDVVLLCIGLAQSRAMSCLQSRWKSKCTGVMAGQVTKSGEGSLPPAAEEEETSLRKLHGITRSTGRPPLGLCVVATIGCRDGTSSPQPNVSAMSLRHPEMISLISGMQDLSDPLPTAATGIGVVQGACRTRRALKT
jgi:hypothetical protein